MRRAGGTGSGSTGRVVVALNNDAQALPSARSQHPDHFQELWGCVLLRCNWLEPQLA